MKARKNAPYLKNRERMIVEITKASPMYDIGERHEVGCYICFDYANPTPAFEKGKDKNGDGIPINECRIIEVLKKKKTPVKTIGWSRSK